MGYGFSFQGKTFTPDGDVPVTETPSAMDEQNKETERQEIAWLRSAPDKVFLYVHLDASYHALSFAERQQRCPLATVTTWPGTVVSDNAVRLGSARVFPAFGGFGSRRRAISVRLFGVLYHGWYFESSGDYCRLTKAKRQGKR